MQEYFIKIFCKQYIHNLNNMKKDLYLSYDKYIYFYINNKSKDVNNEYIIYANYISKYINKFNILINEMHVSL